MGADPGRWLTGAVLLAATGAVLLPLPLPLLSSRCTTTTHHPVAAVENVNIEIAAGTSVVFMGHSGSGKSTLVLALAGLIPVLSGAALVLHGRVQWGCYVVFVCAGEHLARILAHAAGNRQGCGGHTGVAALLTPVP